jgi:hypothetical protein
MFDAQDRLSGKLFKLRQYRRLWSKTSKTCSLQGLLVPLDRDSGGRFPSGASGAGRVW